MKAYFVDSANLGVSFIRDNSAGRESLMRVSLLVQNSGRCGPVSLLDELYGIVCWLVFYV
jgi:hypothetical protein